MLKLARFGERLRTQSNMNLDTNTAVKRLANNPQNNTTAKPLTGPVPKRKRNKMETIVVTCVSIIVAKALSNPVFTAETMFLPLHNSSRIRSKISTLESTDMQIDRNTPEIPGSVRVDPKKTIAAIIRTGL